MFIEKKNSGVPLMLLIWPLNLWLGKKPCSKKPFRNAFEPLYCCHHKEIPATDEPEWLTEQPDAGNVLSYYKARASKESLLLEAKTMSEFVEPLEDHKRGVADRYMMRAIELKINILRSNVNDPKRWNICLKSF